MTHSDRRKNSPHSPKKIKRQSPLNALIWLPVAGIQPRDGIKATACVFGNRFLLFESICTADSQFEMASNRPVNLNWKADRARVVKRIAQESVRFLSITLSFNDFKSRFKLTQCEPEF